MDRIGIIGGGAMGSAIIKGVLQAGLVSAKELYLVEIDQPKRDQLVNLMQINTQASAAALAEECPIIILAVKPQFITPVLIELGSKITPNHLLISIAAGINLTGMQNQLPEAKLIRVMPNTPARIGKGIAAYCLGNKANEADCQTVETILNCIGQVIRVTETQMDAVTAISGSGPAYVFYFLESLIDAGVLLGLSWEASRKLATETVLGAAELLKATGEHPAKLRNEVTSPGGTTAAALFEFEKNGLAGIITKAAVAAAERSRELGNKN